MHLIKRVYTDYGWVAATVVGVLLLGAWYFFGDDVLQLIGA